jgi:DNA invertase Pin-like site-specific DNA recombinase
MKCRRVAYYRVSTEQQGRSGLGLEAQKAAVLAHIASTGCELLASYVEVESGRKNDRTELAKAIRHAKRAKATLVIAKLDRLARNVHFISGLMESRVEFIACDMPSANRMTVHIMAAVAEGEAEMISARTKAALTAAKARGRTKQGKDWQAVKALGARNLTREGTLKGSAAGVAAIKSTKAEAYEHVLAFVRTYRAEGLSLRAIAAKLNADGETTRSGRPWNATQIARVLAMADAA